MADSDSPVAAPTSPRSSHGPRGGHTSEFRGRGQGQGRVGRGNSRGRGRGRGRGFTHTSQSQPDSGPQEMHARPPGGFGVGLTEAATNQLDVSEMNGSKDVEEQSVAEDAEVCFICASPIEHLSIAPCNHQTCHICSLRLRALYKTRACAHCRTEAPFVIFTDNAEKRFQDFTDTDFVKIDENLGVKYEKDIILEDTVLLLRYNCPDKECDVACLGWPDLHRHVKTKHAKVMCDLCTRNKKVFTHEHELFSYGELRRHEKFGDDKPGSEDQSGFKGHPECGFCRQRFYGDDELYNHCREKHERCHICDRRNGGRSPQYYLNYQELEKHFAEAHFVCLDAECQANKTNVFESEMDLKAHQLSEHPNGLSKDARRDARSVNLSGFDLRTPYQPQRRGGGRERGAGRGRDPNAEPLPMSSAQSLSRAELAFQRQVAIQNAQTGPGRTFGGSLTQSVPQARPTQAAASSQPVAVNALPSLDTLSLETSTSTTTSHTPQDQARQLRHAAVTERATALLHNNPTKLSQFRTHVSSYRSGTTTPSDLIDAFFSLFDCSSADLGKLVRELADLYEDDVKRQSLLKAWQDWRSINEDYPSLPGPSGTLPGANPILNNISSGRRVLKLKSSTAQSSRSAVSRSGSWGNALPAGQRDPFPSLSATSASTRSGPAIRVPQAAIWGPTPAGVSASMGAAPTVASTRYSTAGNLGGSNRSNPTNLRPPPTMSTRQNEDMFPSLPAAPKPNVLMAGFNTRGSGRWTNKSGSATPANPWGSSGTSTPTTGSVNANAVVDGVDDALADVGTMQKKKGKNKAKKGEVLYHFG